MKELNFIEKDLLPHISVSELDNHEYLAGSFWIIPKFVGLDYEVVGKKIEVDLKLFGATVLSETITIDEPVIILSASSLMAKAELDVSFVEGCFMWEGKACYKDIKGEWRCLDDSGKILCLV